MSAADWIIVSLAQTAAQPWKNGGGTTRELLAWPDAADWQVRLSVAEVASDGPFSRFDGVQRWFAVLSGDGVRLVVDGRAHALTRVSEPFRFDGAADTQCALLGGATQDFNLMVRGGGRAAMHRLRGRRVSTGEGLQTVYAASRPAAIDSLKLPPHTLAWRASGGPVTVQGDDALWMEVQP